MNANRLELESPDPSLMFPDQGGARRGALLNLLALDEAAAPTANAASRAIADWVRAYLMRPHPDLGRVGHVCPFTSQAARLALLRIGVSGINGSDQAAVLSTMRQALQAFDRMPCKRSQRIFRTVIVGFPHCVDAAGLAMLRDVQNAMRHHSIVQGKMIGLFEPDSQAEGLLNPNFRPLRSPIPALAIRMLVEQDAPFVLRNPLLAPIYLVKFPFTGTRRLLQCAFPGGKTSALAFWWRRLQGRWRHVS